jgi:glyoxylase-like metal-dependent hydrolase (beta-lactamase superfamily II)
VGICRVDRCEIASRAQRDNPLDPDAHSDHIGGAAEILAGSDPEILCSTAERTFIEEGRSLALAARTPLSWAVLGLNHLFLRRRISPLRIDGALDDDEHILGLRVISVPGHTPGQIALLHEQDGVVLSADSVFNVRGHLGHDPTPGLTIDIRQAEASLERLLELGLEDFAPSHGPAMLGDATSRLRRFLDERKAGEG